MTRKHSFNISDLFKIERFTGIFMQSFIKDFSDFI